MRSRTLRAPRGQAGPSGPGGIGRRLPIPSPIALPVRRRVGPYVGRASGVAGRVGLRACSSVGQSARLISVRSAVQIGPGPPPPPTDAAGAARTRLRAGPLTADGPAAGRDRGRMERATVVQGLRAPVGDGGRSGFPVGRSIGRLDIVKRVLDMTRASSVSVGSCAGGVRGRRSRATFGGMLEASGAGRAACSPRGATRRVACWSGRVNEGHLVDALASRGDEGRGTLR